MNIGRVAAHAISAGMSAWAARPSRKAICE